MVVDTERMTAAVRSHLLGAAGGLIAGALGFFAFRWLAERQGLYGLILPGGLLGLGCGLLAEHRSRARGAVCAIAAILLGLFAEWWVFPFNRDASVAFFVSHLHHLKMITWIMLAASALIAFWFGGDRLRAGIPTQARVD